MTNRTDARAAAPALAAPLRPPAHPALRIRQAEHPRRVRAGVPRGRPAAGSTRTPQRPRAAAQVRRQPAGRDRAARRGRSRRYFDELVPIERHPAPPPRCSPEGLELVDAREVWHGFPSAASQLRAAEYEVTVRGNEELTDRGAAGRGGPAARRAEAPGPAAQAARASGARTPGTPRPAAAHRGRGGARRGRARRTAPRCAWCCAWTPAEPGRPEDVVGALDLPLRTAAAVRTRLLFVDTPPDRPVDFTSPRATRVGPRRCAPARATAAARTAAIHSTIGEHPCTPSSAAAESNIASRPGTELIVEQLRRGEPGADRSPSIACCSSVTATR